MIYRLLLLCLSLFCFFDSLAQISTIKIEHPTISERIVAPYDSLKNITRDNLPSLVGQQVQILPYIPSGGSDSATGPTLYSSKPSYYGNNSIVVNPDTRHTVYRSRFGSFTNEVFNIIGTDSIQEELFPFRSVSFFLIVQNDKYPTPHYLELGTVNDTLDSYKNVAKRGVLYTTDGKFVILGYFDKLRKNSIGKKCVVKYPNNSYFGDKILYNLSDGEPLSYVSENLVLTIKDVSLIDGGKYKGLAYIFSSDTESDMFSGLHPKYFEDYDTFLAAQQKRLAAQQERKAWEKDMIRRYGKVNGQLIIEGRVKLGFSKKMCEESWGHPSRINKSTGSWGVFEQWVYGIGVYLYFTNGKLTAIDN